MKELRLGIIGIGNMGSAHLSCIKNGEIENLTVTAVCDIDRKKLDSAEDRYPDISVFEDYRELVGSGKADAVLVATPHCLHAEISAFALENGLHVLSEKPIDICVSAAKKVIGSAKNSGRLFAVMFNQRTNSHFAGARRLVKSGELGELKNVRWIITNWFRTQAYYDSGAWRGTWKGEGGGVLMNQAPHNLDLFQWICGMPSSVTAFLGIGKHHCIDVDDEAELFCEFENGANGLFIISTGEYPGTNRLEINLTGGRIVVEGGVLKLWRLREDERDFSFSCKSGFEEIPFEYSETTRYTETAHKGILQNFTNAVLYGEELIAPGEEGINQLMLANAAYLSHFGGNVRIELPVDAEEYDRFLVEMADKTAREKKVGNETLSAGYNERWKVRF